jgi:hypothetical protein
MAHALTLRYQVFHLPHVSSTVLEIPKELLAELIDCFEEQALLGHIS